jgi:biopolymer transport protein TolR
MQSAAKTPGSGENAVRAEINVTPLVDVCLVLLIIFMVVTPLLVHGVDVNLPQTQGPPKMPEGPNELKVSVKLDGSIHIGSDWIPDELVAARFREIHATNPEKTVVIRADKGLKYRDVRKVMQIANEAGFSGVGLVTQKREEG